MLVFLFLPVEYIPFAIYHRAVIPVSAHESILVRALPEVGKVPRSGIGCINTKVLELVSNAGVGRLGLLYMEGELATLLVLAWG